MLFSDSVKLKIYKTIAETTVAPSAGKLAEMLERPVDDVEHAFHDLAGQRLLVLEPGRMDMIRMAPPFSAVATQHVVVVEGKSYYANCAWDALGISAALGRDAEITSECGDCQLPIAIRIEGGRPAGDPCLIHFAVPASRWWEDIIYT